MGQLSKPGIWLKKKGYVQIYTGDGKGKTTAAIGLAVRASGHGMKTYIGQFMKGMHYGELAVLKDLSHITIEQYGDKCCIRKEEVTDVHVAQAKDGLTRAEAAMTSGGFDIVVFDEINVAIWFGLLEVSEVMAVLTRRPNHIDLIL
ncbi:MAG: cob(I)yrinic acid a,c-diamide adenosyltransferase, partial [Deltaproteobacteria bacterium]|nr:cob(I)yrinic acid a,c-diamide adenosyltransferase [Deltaproteobacteria bacterium]